MAAGSGAGMAWRAMIVLSLGLDDIDVLGIAASAPCENLITSAASTAFGSLLPEAGMPERSLSHSRRPSKLATAAPDPDDDADRAVALLRSQLIQMDARFRDAMARAAGDGPLPPSGVRRRV
jgi:hypothetical protein